MTDPFTLLKNALAGAMGSTPEIAGYVLGAALTVVLLVALTWLLEGFGNKDDEGGGPGGPYVFIISTTLGVVLSTLFGWFPLWVIVFVAAMVVFLIVKPFGGREGV